MNETNPLLFVKSQNWTYRISGDQIEIGCPFENCANKGEPQFYLNIKTGAYLCFRCGQKGLNVKTLAFKLGLIKLVEPDKATSVEITEKEIIQMHRELLTNKDAMAYLTEQRGFKKHTISQFKLGFKHSENHPVIFMPTFNRDYKCVGGEYDFFTRPANFPKYKTMKGSKAQLFNLQAVDLKEKLVITEGRYDAMSLWQYGYENVGSMPNGANSTNEWIDEIRTGKSFYLCTDNDPAGNKAAENLAKELGLYKCYRVYPKMKDINEYLQCDLQKTEIDKVINSAEPMFQIPECNIGQYKEKALEIINSPEEFTGVSTGWDSLDAKLGGIRAEVTASCGVTGHGKTTFALSLISNLIRQGIPCLIVSPEMREQDILLDLASNYHSERVTTEKQIDHFINKNKDKVFIEPIFNSWTKKDASNLQSVFEVIQYYVAHKNVKFVLLDHMRLFLSPKSQDQERFQTEDFIRACVNQSIEKNIHIWLICQYKSRDNKWSGKCKKCSREYYKKLTMDDLKGTANISQDANNVVLIHRYENKFCNCYSRLEEPQIEVEVAKCRSKAGTVGVFRMEFDLDSKCKYYEVS